MKLYSPLLALTLLACGTSNIYANPQNDEVIQSKDDQKTSPKNQPMSPSMKKVFLTSFFTNAGISFLPLNTTNSLIIQAALTWACNEMLGETENPTRDGGARKGAIITGFVTGTIVGNVAKVIAIISLLNFMRINLTREISARRAF